MKEFSVTGALTLHKKNNSNNITESAREYCRINNIPYEQKYRLQLSRFMRSDFMIPSEPNPWVESEGRFMTPSEFCDTYGLDKERMESAKLVIHNAKNRAYNIRFKEQTPGELVKSYGEIFSEILKTYSAKDITPPLANNRIGHRNTFDRVVYSDLHIGMSPNGGKNQQPTFKGSWTEEDILRSGKALTSNILSEQTSSVLYLDDLGDFLDGLGGQTTRKGHSLPQSMSDKTVFDLGVRFKLNLLEDLLPHYSKIVCHSVIEDNHSGVFSYFVNKAVKDICDVLYKDRVEYIIEESFMSHYSVGCHTFILSHGKDSTDMKFGFRAICGEREVAKIDDYCKYYGLYKSGNRIEFSKGDSHQKIFDSTTSLDFDYFSYPAMSPPSNWVKTNFKNSKYGWVFFSIDYDTHRKVEVATLKQDRGL